MSDELPERFANLELWPGLHVILDKWDRRSADALLDHIRRDSFGRAPQEAFIFGRGFGDGQHPDMFTETLKKMQKARSYSFITTANPAVVNALYFTSAEDFRRRVIVVPREGAVTHFAREQAVNFYEAYRAEMQPVSEILRDKGLW